MKKPRRPTDQNPTNAPGASSRRKVAELLRLVKEAQDELLAEQDAEPSDSDRSAARLIGITFTKRSRRGPRDRVAPPRRLKGCVGSKARTSVGSPGPLAIAGASGQSDHQAPTDKARPGRPRALKPPPRGLKRRGRAGILLNVLVAPVLVAAVLLISLPALLVFLGRPEEATKVALALIDALTALAKAMLAR